MLQLYCTSGVCVCVCVYCEENTAIRKEVIYLCIHSYGIHILFIKCRDSCV